MQDAITNVLNKYDLTGKYLDTFALSTIQNYFSNAVIRIKAIELINSKSSKIVREAGTRLYNEQPELLRPGGNSYTTRRYAACLRDIEYYLRYASYAIMAGDINILNERVLDGLRETYNSLNVPIGPTIRSIKILEEIIQNELQFTSPDLQLIINEPFEHMINSLGEENI
uniref:allophycocyanin beta 18 subunit n=1 Tax=Hypnea wynnei TaxID=1867777 RepID=UPI0027D9E7EA|nr:allophycocyanin beta 18 subunit [Hypnea wynnei]WCH56489.1 allophycocyanin beta 18 subunit [Hypnea wynnei]